MFLWCSYCQHLIGEMPPLQDFRVTHGMCEPCAQDIANFAPTPGLLQAKAMYATLEEAGRRGDFEACSAAVDAALETGLRASEIIVGVLHPALAHFGQLWESGEISVTEEHRFTDLALRLMDRLRFPQPPENRPLAVLAVYPENRHDIGLRMLQILAWERGIPCERMPAGTSARAIEEFIVSRHPDLVGLSVSLLESIPGALALAYDLSALLQPSNRLVLGGQAFRRHDSPDLNLEWTVLPTVDAYVDCLEQLQHRFSHTESPNGTEPTDQPS